MLRNFNNTLDMQREKVYNDGIKDKGGINMPVKVGLRHIELWNDTLENKVLEYEKEQVEPGQIVFYGPSYYTRWSEQYGAVPLREVIRGDSGKPCCVNRGFGSSCAEHQLYYYPRMVRPLCPSVLVYESFANGGSFGYTPEETFELAQRVMIYARTDFPGIHIYIAGPHPSVNQTAEALERKTKYAAYLKEFAQNTPDCSYIDVFNYAPLYNDDGTLNKDMFVADGVHFSNEGYKVITELYKTALKDELKRF